MFCQSDVLLEISVEGFLGLCNRWVRCARCIDERGLNGGVREDFREVGFT